MVKNYSLKNAFLEEIIANKLSDETGKLESEKHLKEAKKQELTIKDNQPVELKVVYESFFGGKDFEIFAADTYLQALKDIINRLLLDIDIDEIEEQNLTCEDILDLMEDTNDDNIQPIYLIKDLLTGKTIFNPSYDADDDW